MLLSTIVDDAGAVLLQYGALGAIVAFTIVGVAWLFKTMRSDMVTLVDANKSEIHAMINQNARQTKEFTDFLRQQIRQQMQTNNAFVHALDRNTDAIEKLSAFSEEINRNSIAIHELRRIVESA